MVISEENIKRLRTIFNLNIYEVKIWTALLSKGVDTAGGLSEITNVPRSRAYDVLESLEKRGFIIMKLGRPIKYLAVEPNEIIKRAKKNHEEKAKREVKALEEVRNTEIFTELDLLFKQGINHIDPNSIAGTFKGRRAIYDQIQTLISNAEKSVLIATTSEGLVRKFDNFKNEFKKSKANIKILAPLITKEAKEAAKELKEFVTIKDYDPKSRFIIVDNSDLLFITNSETHESAEIAIWSKTPLFSQTLSYLVESSIKK